MRGNPDPSPDTRFGAQRGNTPGRKHTKDKLSQAFLKDLQEVWAAQGKQVLERLAQEGDLKANAAIAKIVAGMEPKEIEMSRPTDAISDEGLAKLIELASRLTEEKTA